MTADGVCTIPGMATTLGRFTAEAEGARQTAIIVDVRDTETGQGTRVRVEKERIPGAYQMAHTELQEAAEQRAIASYLHDDDWFWIDARGQHHNIVLMPIEHAYNVVLYLQGKQRFHDPRLSVLQDRISREQVDYERAAKRRAISCRSCCSGPSCAA